MHAMTALVLSPFARLEGNVTWVGGGKFRRNAGIQARRISSICPDPIQFQDVSLGRHPALSYPPQINTKYSHASDHWLRCGLSFLVLYRKVLLRPTRLNFLSAA